MTDALVVSNVVLWAMVLVLAGIVMALARQIGVLHERVAPVGALALGRGPRVGDAAPVIEVADLLGMRRAVGGPAPDGRDTLLLFVSPTCPVCESLLPVVHAIARSEGEGLRVILASDGPIDEHRAFVRARGLERYPYVLSTELGVAWQVSKLPYAALIDREGIVRAKGLVNSREHLESLFEAKERGVASIQEWVAQQDAGAEVAQ